MMSAAVRIDLVPTHPAEGRASMNRYAQHLERAARDDGTLRYRLRARLHPDEPVTAREGAVARVLKARLGYGARLALQPPAALVHVLDHSSAHLLPFLRHWRRPLVVTAHDIIPLYAEEGLSPVQHRRFAATLGRLHLADRIIADSQFTRNDLVCHLGLDPGRIEVVWLGVDAGFTLAGARAERPEQAFVVLSVGSDVPRKNLGALPAILAGLKARIARPVTLVRIGGGLVAPLRDELGRLLGSDGLLELGAADDEVLRRWYRAADAFLMPSQLEGFGFPVLEAMACGCPVVTSRASSLGEIMGPSLGFDPNQPEEAAVQLARIANEPDLADRLRAEGPAWAAGFTWQRHLHGVMAVYRQLGLPLDGSRAPVA